MGPSTPIKFLREFAECEKVLYNTSGAARTAIFLRSPLILGMRVFFGMDFKSSFKSNELLVGGGLTVVGLLALASGRHDMVSQALAPFGVGLILCDALARAGKAAREGVKCWSAATNRLETECPCPNGRLVVAVTGASGALYAVRFLRQAARHFERIYVMLSDNAGAVFAAETGGRPPRLIGPGLPRRRRCLGNHSVLGHQRLLLAARLRVVRPRRHGGHPLLDGHAGPDRRRHLQRPDHPRRRCLPEGAPQADPRHPRHSPEPYSSPQHGLRHRGRAVILPAVPAFYYQPKTVEDVVDTVVARVPRTLNFPTPSCPNGRRKSDLRLPWVAGPVVCSFSRGRSRAGSLPVAGPGRRGAAKCCGQRSGRSRLRRTSGGPFPAVRRPAPSRRRRPAPGVLPADLTARPMLSSGVNFSVS